MHDIRKSQQELCGRFGAPFVEADVQLKIGLSKNFGVHDASINGLRYPPEGDTTGWYIWSGEWSDAPDFFSTTPPISLLRSLSRPDQVLRFGSGVALPVCS